MKIAKDNLRRGPRNLTFSPKAMLQIICAPRRIKNIASKMSMGLERYISHSFFKDRLLISSKVG